MSENDNKALVRRYYEHVVSAGQLDRIEDFISPDYVEVHDGIRHEIGIDGARDHILGVRRTYSDFSLRVDQQIAEGEWVVSLVTISGVHSGIWLGMRPTGKRVEMTGVNVDRVIDGLIVQHGGAANVFGPLLEIGAIKIADPVEDR